MSTQEDKVFVSSSSLTSASPVREENEGATTPLSSPLISDSSATDTEVKEDNTGNDDNCMDVGDGMAGEKSIQDLQGQEEHKKNENSNREEELVECGEPNLTKPKTTATTTKEESPMDEEGLKRDGYDVILVGTGLIQSILASALTRAGKSVLHCDGNDFYGEKDAVFSLGSLMDWSKEMRNKEEQKRKGSCDNDIEEHEDENYANANDLSPSISICPAGALSSIEIHSESGTEAAPILKKGMDVITPYGEGTVLSLPAITPSNNDNHKSLAVQLSHWTMADGRSPTAYFGYHDCNQKEMKTSKDEEGEGGDSTFSNIAAYYAKTNDIIPKTLFQFQKYIIGRKRSFALDLTPGLLYASGSAVDGMIDSGVSAYCEFKSLVGLHLFMEQQQKKKSSKLSKSPTATATASSGLTGDGGNTFELSRVPCSKRDVFQTKLLSPVDKRRLMKFLQIASDYAFSQIHEDGAGSGKDNNDATEKVGKISQTEDSINASAGGNSTPSGEDAVTSLNERLLQQGRSLYRPQNKSVSTSDLERLQQCIDDRMDFKDYLETEHKLPPRLRDIVMYAMAMGSTRSHEHGKSERTFYSTGSGMADLSLHLRSLGKFGGTAFLVPLYGAGELSQAFCRSAAVHGGTYLLRRGVSGVLVKEYAKREEVRGVVLNQDSSENGDEELKKDKEIISRHVVISSDALPRDDQSGTMRSKVFRRISILRGKLIQNGEDKGDIEQRHIIIVPPNTIGNTNVIHGIALDESVNVAPYYYGGSFSTTVLHLTTIVDGASISGMDAEDVLQKAVQLLIGRESGCSQVEEIYHLSFSSTSLNNSIAESDNFSSIDGLHICQEHSHSITVESAFQEASLIFRKICPNSKFLSLSSEMDDRVKESRAGITEDDDDQDKAMLDSAMNMMTSSN